MGTLGMQPRSQNKNQIFQSLSIQTNEYNPLTQKKKRKKKKERDFTSRSLPKAQICMPNRATPNKDNPLTQKKKNKKDRDFTSRSLPKAQICLTELPQAACLDLTEGLSNQPEGLSREWGSLTTGVVYCI